jgi:hypothetical protein
MTLYELLKVIVFTTTGRDLHDKLVIAVLATIHKKMYTQAIHRRTKYTVSLTPCESIALYLYWSDHNTLPLNSFEGNLLRKITDSIHQHIC